MFKIKEFEKELKCNIEKYDMIGVNPKTDEKITVSGFKIKKDNRAFTVVNLNELKELYQLSKDIIFTDEELKSMISDYEELKEEKDVEEELVETYKEVAEIASTYNSIDDYTKIYFIDLLRDANDCFLDMITEDDYFRENLGLSFFNKVQADVIRKIFRLDRETDPKSEY